ncbi:hypothetical protein OG758_01300 [Streptomyces sp. NBC_01474]|uniref:hypothetical protein n=1 Tax=unclassified Streptomyces TaxID=2593676 RepID=UPI002DDAA845|nr:MULTISPECIES: hypothetical protein [unclassified Streptomyces]WSD92972.1 hypothetical protein OG758_01300 [Streptomyces sp. NBC_01474]
MCSSQQSIWLLPPASGWPGRPSIHSTADFNELPVTARPDLVRCSGHWWVVGPGQGSAGDAGRRRADVGDGLAADGAHRGLIKGRQAAVGERGEAAGISSARSLLRTTTVRARWDRP